MNQTNNGLELNTDQFIEQEHLEEFRFRSKARKVLRFILEKIIGIRFK